MKFHRFAKSCSYPFYVLAVLLSTSIFTNEYVDNYNPETSKFHVVTCASQPKKQLKQLLVTAKHHGLEVEVLGLGKPYPGNGRKLRYYLEYLQTAPKDDIILFVDAYDVLIMADQKTILDKFHQMKVPFLISTDTLCYPFADLANQYPPTSSIFKYINSGGFIGYAGYLKDLFSDLPPFKNMQSDQGVLTKHFLTHKESYCLDYGCSIFISMFHLNQSHFKVDREAKKIYSIISETYPCIIHGDGFEGKQVYQDFFNALFL